MQSNVSVSSEANSGLSYCRSRVLDIIACPHRNPAWTRKHIMVEGHDQYSALLLKRSGSVSYFDARRAGGGLLLARRGRRHRLRELADRTAKRLVLPGDGRAVRVVLARQQRKLLGAGRVHHAAEVGHAGVDAQRDVHILPQRAAGRQPLQPHAALRRARGEDRRRAGVLAHDVRHDVARGVGDVHGGVRALVGGDGEAEGPQPRGEAVGDLQPLHHERQVDRLARGARARRVARARLEARAVDARDGRVDAVLVARAARQVGRRGVVALEVGVVGSRRRGARAREREAVGRRGDVVLEPRALVHGAVLREREARARLRDARGAEAVAVALERHAGSAQLAEAPRAARGGAARGAAGERRAWVGGRRGERQSAGGARRGEVAVGGVGARVQLNRLVARVEVGGRGGVGVAPHREGVGVAAALPAQPERAGHVRAVIEAHLQDIFRATLIGGHVRRAGSRP
mmetsp:Transcript_32437/g.67992  ORF Transcript_32437/g.67992 Transcript_32437/m.67992 type:complete len:460 (+) Transcript_32437:152-1531(+)